MESKFCEIDIFIHRIDSFENYYAKNIDNRIFLHKKNQLFSKEIPPFDFVEKIISILIHKKLDSHLYYEFSRKTLIQKDIVVKIKEYIPELKTYYLKCKHTKYLDHLNEKKVITLFRQILKPYDFTIDTIEKYDHNKKYLLYVLQKKQISLKKVNSMIYFD